MRRFASLLLFVAIAAPAPAAAQSGEQGSVCVHDFVPGLSCSCEPTSRSPRCAVVDIVEDVCGGHPDTAHVTLDVGALDSGRPEPLRHRRSSSRSTAAAR